MSLEAHKIFVFICWLRMLLFIKQFGVSLAYVRMWLVAEEQEILLWGLKKKKKIGKRALMLGII